MPGSPLEPYLDWIWEQRGRNISWPAIANALSQKIGQSIGGKRVEAYAKYNQHRSTLPAPQPDRPPDPPPTLAAKPPGTVRDIHDLLTLPPTPFAVPVPQQPAPAVLRGWTRTLLVGDTHFPHQDDAALACVRAIYAKADCTRLVHMGDLLDCYELSRFDKDPNRKHNLQHEIDAARTWLHQMAQLNPAAERWLLEGNHEDRLRKTIWNLPGGGSALAKLTTFREAMTWPSLLGLDDIGWRFVPTHEQTRANILPKLILKHGTVVRKWSGMTAKGEWERYGKGGASGHTHRLGKFYHRDHNGSHLWIESGCTCTLQPDYMVDPDWQQGCVVITHTADGERYHVEDIYIQDGVALWRDMEVAA